MSYEVGHECIGYSERGSRGPSLSGILKLDTACHAHIIYVWILKINIRKNVVLGKTSDDQNKTKTKTYKISVLGQGSRPILIVTRQNSKVTVFQRNYLNGPTN